MTTVEIAEVAHEVNRAYCAAIGDPSQDAWGLAPNWQRESAVKGVELHLAGDVDPSAAHEAWMKEKIEAGWKRGPVKNPDIKEHPCICPFEDLPVVQQVKDHIFTAVVRALRKHATPVMATAPVTDPAIG